MERKPRTSWQSAPASRHVGDPAPRRAPLPRRRVRRGCADPAPPAGPSGAAGSGQPLGTLRSPPRPRGGANRAGERVPRSRSTIARGGGSGSTEIWPLTATPPLAIVRAGARSAFTGPVRAASGAWRRPGRPQGLPRAGRTARTRGRGRFGAPPAHAAPGEGNARGAGPPTCLLVLVIWRGRNRQYT